MSVPVPVTLISSYEGGTSKSSTVSGKFPLAANLACEAGFNAYGSRPERGE